ncbi:MAG TPA: tetratricopeptide repeat protein [Ruminiclostridium sp.]
MDLNQEIKSFTTIDIEKFSQNSEVSEKIIDSVKSYNNAIENLKTGSEDIAMIELKRVVSSNPDFYEAVNLLGLCYAFTNQMDKAEELFGKVVQVENNVIKAADYLNYITSGENNSSKKSTKSKNTKPVNKVTKAIKEPAKKANFSEEDVQTEYFLLKKIGTQIKKTSVAARFNVFSVICLIAALVFFYAAANTKDAGKVDTNSEPAVNTQLTASNNNLVAENKELKIQIASANVKLKQIQLASDFSQVSVLYGQRKYVEAADKLLSLPLKELSADLKTKYASIKGNVLLEAANLLTNDGNALYVSKKYPEAIKKLEKVFTLGNKWTFGDKALYILGKSYVEVNEIQKGAQAYQKIINEYPNSGYLKYAKSRLESIQ